jgi:hypothetical protein
MKKNGDELEVEKQQGDGGAGLLIAVGRLF